MLKQSGRRSHSSTCVGTPTTAGLGSDEAGYARTGIADVEERESKPHRRVNSRTADLRRGVVSEGQKSGGAEECRKRRALSALRDRADILRARQRGSYSEYG